MSDFPFESYHSGLGRYRISIWKSSKYAILLRKVYKTDEESSDVSKYKRWNYVLTLLKNIILGKAFPGFIFA